MRRLFRNRSEVFEDPKALALWIMAAVVLWLVIPFAAQVGLWIWGAQNPGVTWEFDPYDMPPYIWHGLIGMLIGLALVVLVCVKLRFGVLWLLVAVLLAALTLYYLPGLLGAAGTVLGVLLPPIIGAALFPPRSPSSS